MVWYRNMTAVVPVLNMSVHCGTWSTDCSCRPLVDLPHILDWALFYNHLKAILWDDWRLIPVLVHCIFTFFLMYGVSKTGVKWSGVYRTGVVSIGQRWCALESTGQDYSRSRVFRTGVVCSEVHRTGEESTGKKWSALEFTGQEWIFQFSKNVLGYSTLITASFCSSDLLCLALLVQGVNDLVSSGQL